ncbi:MAG TPA: iron-containing alcohol dehydrogenase [Smithella sp.]|jgi:alcohol dehydrogenase|nr:iron-containing alcohol dehydrogenase [Smithella sp.]HNQ66234.1 iron-containing alcohol dehydrogenase [Smithella sp.]HOE33236.1 iron-containing alcohol dehydrogenase [Smithella sp.]HOG10604.1 iron-containing alcohol dehydrogenase [Smithella sp.]HOO35566.1 iron-containing alcohol dehydrogenase [Smithella sp.]
MNITNGFAFICPFKTNSGNKALEHLPVELAGFNAFKPLIITSRQLAGWRAISTLKNAFGDSGMTLGLFDDVTQTADLNVVEQIRDIFVKGQYDVIIALGGGIIVDVAKIVNLAVSQKVADACQLSPATAIRDPLGPLVVIPTFAVNGMETSKYAVLSGKTFTSVHLMPDLVVLDPRLTRAKDGKTVAEAGIAAFGRTLEAYIAPDKNPFMDAYAFTAMRFIRENLALAVKKRCNKKESLAVANAVAMSGCVISNTDQNVLHRLGQVFQNTVHVHPGVIIGMCLYPLLDDTMKKGNSLVSNLLLLLGGDDKYAAMPEAGRTGAALREVYGFTYEIYSMLKGKMPQTIREAGIPQYLMDDVLEVINQEPDGTYLRTVIDRVGGSTKA